MAIDTHTHSAYSADASVPASQMIEKAIELGLDYYAVTDHCDKDYLNSKVKNVRQIDAEAQFAEITALKEKFKDKITIGVGLELGYSFDGIVESQKILSARDYDYIINSIHVVDGEDAYFGGFFKGKDKKEAYTRYLTAVRESLDAPYRYETVGHIGYITRYAPYADTNLYYNEFPELIDDILSTIIKKNKILELNTNVKGLQTKMLPNIEILKRYKELGGKLVTFGSDAHTPSRVAENYDLVIGFLNELGYSELAYYNNKKLQFYPI